MANKHEPVAMTKESGAKSKRLNEIDEVCASSKQSSHLVLVHGRAAKPIDKIERGNFTQEVRNELENMRLRDVYHIQSFTWPHLMRGNSAIVINSPRTGKTMSYLPAICSLVQMLSEDNRVVDGPGPVAIIVADSSIAVERISKMCRRFYRSFEDPFSVAESYGMRAKPKTIAKLLSGCKILIATPSALARLLKEKVELFRLQRIRYLVFDNIDLIHEELKDDLRTIIKKFCVRDVNTGKTSLQIAVTARSWHPLLMGFLKISNNPQLCIGAYLEGAVYGRSEFQMKFAGKNKMLEILDFLEEHPSSSQPTLIICNNDSDVDEAVETLKASTCFYVSVCSSSTALEIDMALHWGSKCLSSGDLSILVCTDCVLPKIKLTNVQNSIHYSLPKSWSQFSYRFSAHFGYYEDFVKKEKAEKPPAVSLILVDKNNNYQLPKLIEFFEKHDCKIPMEARNLSNQIKMQLEEERIENNKLLCNQLLEFGQCWKNSDCTYRHSFSQFDWPGDDIPANGHIKVEILSVVSPTHYCVRLLEHKEDNPDASWKPINRSNAYLEFSSEFSTYFSDPNNHQTHHPYNLNDLCVLKEENTYYRCKILAENISKKKMSSGNASGQVKLLDFGNIISCKFMDLLVLPEQFKKFPYQAVDLRLTGIVPSDFEWEWDTKTTATVWHWVKTYVTENRYVQAGVVLSLMDTIWVDSLVIMEKLETISSHVSYINIKKCLVEENFAIINEEGLQVITEMARNCGLLNRYNKSKHLSNSSSTTASQPVTPSDPLPSSTQITNEPQTSKGLSTHNSWGSLNSLNSVNRAISESNMEADLKHWEYELLLGPVLKTLRRCPQVTWKQSNSVICLQIYAPDTNDFYLNVTAKTLVFSTRRQNQLHTVVLNFFGELDPNETSFEIKELYVVIWLIKELKGFTWPRLTWESDKPTWLKYEGITVDKEFIKNSGQCRLDSHYGDESSSEVLTSAEKTFGPFADDSD